MLVAPRSFVLPIALVASLSACGGEASPESTIVGDWAILTISTQDVSVTCPGEGAVNSSLSLICIEDSISFGADESVIRVLTREQTGASRREGSWLTEDDLLTLVFDRGGDDNDPLRPIEPPELVYFEWAIEEGQLLLWIEYPWGPVIQTYERQ